MMKFLKNKKYIILIILILVLTFSLAGLMLYVNAAASVSTQETTMTRMIAALSRTKDTNNELNTTIMQEELNKYLGSGKATTQESSGLQTITYGNSNNAYTINDNLEYTITYDANGGTGTLASQTKKFGHRVKTHSTGLTRSGYNFLGWSTDSSATTAMYQPGKPYMSNENVTLYAVWESDEQVVIPNTTDYPTSVYNSSLLNYGGSLTVNETGAYVNTWQTNTDYTHIVCLPIDVSDYQTLTYTATTTGTNNDGNYRTTLGFATDLPTTSELNVTSYDKFDVKGIMDGWCVAQTFTGSFDVSSYTTIYAILGQGTTWASGNYGHGTTGFSSIVLSNGN